MSTNFQVRDFRHKHYFQVDDEYLNGFARICGPATSMVYLAICRHANREQKSWPSIETLATKLAISRRTVVRAIKTLERYRIIAVVRGRDPKTKHQLVNVYALLDKSNWLRVTPGKPDPGDINDTTRVTNATQTRVTPRPLEGTYVEVENVKEEEPPVDNRDVVKTLDKLRKELVAKKIIK